MGTHECYDCGKTHTHRGDPMWKIEEYKGDQWKVRELDETINWKSWDDWRTIAEYSCTRIRITHNDKVRVSYTPRTHRDKVTQ